MHPARKPLRTKFEMCIRDSPTLIQEQNSYAGVTNKLLAQKARKICVAYDGMEKFFPADKIITGHDGGHALYYRLGKFRRIVDLLRILFLLY